MTTYKIDLNLLWKYKCNFITFAERKVYPWSVIVTAVILMTGKNSANFSSFCWFLTYLFSSYLHPWFIHLNARLYFIYIQNVLVCNVYKCIVSDVYKSTAQRVYKGIVHNVYKAQKIMCTKVLNIKCTEPKRLELAQHNFCLGWLEQIWYSSG